MIKKSATARLSGTIDKNNLVTLEGVITLDGENEKVNLSGKAYQVFIGWDVPKGAKPIITKLSSGPISHIEGITETYATYGNLQNNISKIDNVTITRYEGATKMYATYVDLQDKEGKYKLHGEFYKDGTGGIVGKVMKNGVECDLGLLGLSKSLYENVNPTVSPASSSNFLDVPQRSQWEIYWYSPYNYTAASQACGEASAAMLQEYYTGQRPEIWNIWVACGSHAVTGNDLMSYFNSIGMGYIGLAKAWGTTPDYVNTCIGYVEAVVDMQHPMILQENSRWGTPHSVILRGYTSQYFILNDPNTLTGSNTMYWYHKDLSTFNFEDNVVKWVGGDDNHNTGLAALW
ncbi:C39 family peptidase [Methanosarcina horonobensis]|uniref:C39 family peptidase n=1 Tax=Methanosarcina horonobensis TaxID=418008 RepID=UPI000A757F1F|nr:C39 family peptidase [Methanosarcina horonobensis]